MRIFSLILIAVLSLVTHMAWAITPKQQKVLDELAAISDDVVIGLNAHVNEDSPYKADLTDKAKVANFVAKAKRCQDLVDEAVLKAGLASGYPFEFKTHDTLRLTSPLSLAAFGRDICARSQQLNEQTLATLP